MNRRSNPGDSLTGSGKRVERGYLMANSESSGILKKGGKQPAKKPAAPATTNRVPKAPKGSGQSKTK